MSDPVSAPETREDPVPSREYVVGVLKTALAGRVPLEDTDGTPNYVLIRVRDALAACALLAATPPAPEVTEEMVTAFVVKTRGWFAVRAAPPDEFREAIRTGLTAALRATRREP